MAGRNVKMLMSFTDADRHDGHIQRYLTSGKTKVIGSGRQVKNERIFSHADTHTIDMYLYIHAHHRHSLTTFNAISFRARPK